MECLQKQVNELKKNQDVLTNLITNMIEELANVNIRITNEKVNLEYLIEINRNDIKNNVENMEALNLEENELKQNLLKETLNICPYFDEGYCKLLKTCKFVHSEENCELFDKEGICITINCRKRHRKICRYWRENYCFRGESCAFRHGDLEIYKKCDQCDKDTTNLYYCEFCGKDLCNKCTNEEAHDAKAFMNRSKLSCKDIHIIEDKLNRSEKSEYLERCQCGKTCLKENCECENCGKYFCKSCPASPIDGHSCCLECVFRDVMSSTLTEQ